MAISKSVALPNTMFDASGTLIAAAYWHIIELEASPPYQSLKITYGGFASSAAYAAGPQQVPLMTKEICFPDTANQPTATWPFSPSALAANYPNNPLAMLLAADAYALNDPFFSGGSEVS